MLGKVVVQWEELASSGQDVLHLLSNEGRRAIRDAPEVEERWDKVVGWWSRQCLGVELRGLLDDAAGDLADSHG